MLFLKADFDSTARVALGVTVSCGPYWGLGFWASVPPTLGDLGDVPDASLPDTSLSDASPPSSVVS